jgi:hypothetical protein
MVWWQNINFDNVYKFVNNLKMFLFVNDFMVKKASALVSDKTVSIVLAREQGC